MNNENFPITPATSKVLGLLRSQNGAMLQGATIVCDGLETKTLADGSFILSSIPVGEHEVTASLQGFKTTTWKVSVKEGDNVIEDLHLANATGTARIRGRVFDAETKKVIDKCGTVMLILPLANKYSHIDSDGHYQLENLPAGRYKVATSIQGYNDSETTLEVADRETKTYDFFCYATRTVEPSWG